MEISPLHLHICHFGKGRESWLDTVTECETLEPTPDKQYALYDSCHITKKQIKIHLYIFPPSFLILYLLKTPHMLFNTSKNTTKHLVEV